MAWITSTAVEPLVQTDLSADTFISALINHAEALAEIEVGVQTEPVSAGLQAVLAQIVARMWRAGQGAAVNPGGFQSETSPEYGYSVPTGPTLAAGLGLTNQEKKDLKRAAGVNGLWVQPTTRGDVETARLSSELDDWLEGAL